MQSKKELGVFILAAGQNNLGQQEKWGSEKQRFLVPVCSEPLLLRTVRQLHGLGYDDIIVVTDSLEVQSAVSAPVPGTVADTVADSVRCSAPVPGPGTGVRCPGTGVQVLEPERTKGWVDTFLGSSVAWDDYDRIMVLQADVVWSDSAIKWAFSCVGSPVFGGVPLGVVHFIAADRVDYETIKERAVKLELAGTRGDTCSRLLQEFCPRPWPLSGQCPYFSILPHDDFTADMDSYEFYEQWVENHPKA